MNNPTPQQIKQARLNASLTQKQAGELIHATLRTWQDWEHGKRVMSLANWELFLIKVGKLK